MILTPNPVGEVPAGVLRVLNDALGRLRLNITAADRRRLDRDRSGVVLDRATDLQFWVEFDIDCGGGCRCAAQAMLLTPIEVDDYRKAGA